MKIRKSCLPKDSYLDRVICDYIDSYEGIFYDPHQQVTSSIIGKAFLTSSPTWVGVLFEIRNRIVRIFGLKTFGKIKDRKKLIEEFNCEKGERLGLFKVYNKSDKEVVLGEDDRHLNFRISLFQIENPDHTESNNLIITTSVIFHNRMGRIYFRLIRPFHKLIVPRMLKNLLRQLNYISERSA